MPQISLKAGREKSIRRRHPWVFSGAIARVNGNPEAGSTVRVVSDSGEFLAYAAWSPRSQIRARAWSFDAASTINAAFIRQRIARAIELRRQLHLMDDAGACRLVFSEADGLPGLIVDRYRDYLVCQLLSVGAEFWREAIVAALEELLVPRAIYERSDASVRHKEGLELRSGLLRGELPGEPVEYTLHGVRQLVSIEQGQKTGSYLDQSVNRLRVAAYAKGASVLDAYSYSGGFALAALHHGAADASLIDSSAEALQLAAHQATLNGVAARCQFTNANVPQELRRLRDSGQRYDLVVLDPPKFVSSAQQLQSGCRGYKDINMLGLQLLKPGGVLATFSCSGHVSADLFQKIVAGAAADVRCDAQIIERLSQAPDHPVALQFPEADYLCGLLVRMLP
ncbi:MAG: class I SAM-dependent methyltransferase [Gammaproteobacteria bacterium]|nr:class I SAM-dependent methyltransferase [Gammaproteobacteria bacterium]MDH5302749.1 class I SAM-dependent methyltransferase [Gammaproteobacteria bacterium]MDH5321319.1 class I SAM-dependent methyltransferase [Gammaproteobacteria bacterium]